MSKTRSSKPPAQRVACGGTDGIWAVSGKVTMAIVGHAPDEMTRPTEAKLLRSREVAERLAVSEKTVRRYVRDGLLGAVRLRGGLRFEEAGVTAFVHGSRVGRVHGREAES